MLSCCCSQLQTTFERSRRAINQRLRSSWAVEAGLPPNHQSSCLLKRELRHPSKLGHAPDFASDYIYRGVTLSDHKPAVGTAIEAALGPFYAGATFTSVKLPNEHAVELTAMTGVRSKLWNVDWDFGWTYFAYPGGSPSGPRIDYWEVGGRAETNVTGSVRMAAGFAYSPNAVGSTSIQTQCERGDKRSRRDHRIVQFCCGA